MKSRRDHDRLPCLITILQLLMSSSLRGDAISAALLALISSFGCDVCRKTVAEQREMFFFVQDDSRLTGKKKKSSLQLPVDSNQVITL